MPRKPVLRRSSVKADGKSTLVKGSSRSRQVSSKSRSDAPQTPQKTRGQDRRSSTTQPSSRPPKRPLKRSRAAAGSNRNNDGFDPDEDEDEDGLMGPGTSHTDASSSSSKEGATAEAEDEDEEDMLATYPRSLRDEFNGAAGDQGAPASKRSRTLAGAQPRKGSGARARVRQASSGGSKKKGAGKQQGRSKSVSRSSKAPGGSPVVRRRSRRSASGRRTIPWRGAFRALLCAGMAPVTSPALALVPVSQALLAQAAAASGEEDNQEEAKGTALLPSRRSAPAGGEARRVLRRKWQDATAANAAAVERHLQHKERALRLRLRLGEALDRLTARVATPATNAGYGLGGVGAFEASRRLRESGGSSLGAKDTARVALDGADRGAFLALCGTSVNNHKDGGASGTAGSARVRAVLHELEVARRLGLGDDALGGQMDMSESDDEEEEEEEEAGPASGAGGRAKKTGTKAGFSIDTVDRQLVDAVDRVLPGEPAEVSGRSLWELRRTAEEKKEGGGWETVSESEKKELQAEARKRLGRRTVAALARALTKPLRVTVRMNSGYEFDQEEAALDGADSAVTGVDGEAGLPVDTRRQSERVSSYVSAAIARAEGGSSSSSKGAAGGRATYGPGAAARAAKAQAGARRAGEELGALGLPVALLRTCGPVRTSGAPMVLPTAAGFKRISQRLSQVVLTFQPDLTVEQAVAEYRQIFAKRGEESPSAARVAASIDALAASITGRLTVSCHYVTEVSAGAAAPEPAGLLHLAAPAAQPADKVSAAIGVRGRGGSTGRGAMPLASSASPAVRLLPGSDGDESGAGSPVAMRLDFGEAEATMHTPPSKGQRSKRGSAVARRQALAAEAAGALDSSGSLPSSQQSDGILGAALRTPPKSATVSSRKRAGRPAKGGGKGAAGRLGSSPGAQRIAREAARAIEAGAGGRNSGRRTSPRL